MLINNIYVYMKNKIKTKLRRLLFEGEYDIFTNKSGEDFWGDIGAGVLVICTSTGRVLVNYRSSYVNEPNTIGVFGGAVDISDNETVKDAVIREFSEESGYNGQLELIDAYVFQSSGGGFKYFNFIGLVPNEFKPKLDWESDGYKWLTLSELINWDWEWDEYDITNFNIKGEPIKHFGLSSLLNDPKSLSIIKRYGK